MAYTRYVYLIYVCVCIFLCHSFLFFIFLTNIVVWHADSGIGTIIIVVGKSSSSFWPPAQQKSNVSQMPTMTIPKEFSSVYEISAPQPL